MVNQITGTLRKMQVKYTCPIEYTLIVAEGDNNYELVLNDLLEREIKLAFSGSIYCIFCGKVTKKSYNSGYCFACAKTLARCDFCIVRPQLCHYHEGTCREPSWGEQNCFVPHIVYLANSSGIKVGITRESQIPTRWIDQGAIQALPIVRTQSRYQAGLIEVAIAKLISDRTSWKKMLATNIEKIDLENKRDEILKATATEIQAIAKKFQFGDIELLTNEKLQEFTYPHSEIIEPQKITRFSVSKELTIAGKFIAIKGQYLIIGSKAINIRNLTGYELTFAH